MISTRTMASRLIVRPLRRFLFPPLLFLSMSQGAAKEDAVQMAAAWEVMAAWLMAACLVAMVAAAATNNSVVAVT